MDAAQGMGSLREIANVSIPEEQEQIRGLGRLGRSLRRSEEATDVRQEPVSRRLKVAGFDVRPPYQRHPDADSIAAHRPLTNPVRDSRAASLPITDLGRGPSPGWSSAVPQLKPDGEPQRGLPRASRVRPRRDINPWLSTAAAPGAFFAPTALAKLIGMAVTVASGWRGGFIIPLFFIGAALGHAYRALVPTANEAVIASALMAAANTGVTKTPLGSTLVVSEMVGLPPVPSTAVAAVVSLLLTHRSGLLAS